MFPLTDFLKKIEKRMGFKTKIKWRNVFIMLSYHAIGFYWIYSYALPTKWQTVLVGIISYIISGSGITCGVHRMWTHRCYKAKLPLRIYLMLVFASTGQNSIYDWVRDHRVHHKYSDTEADPHNVNRGFFFSHMGWLLMEKNQLVLEKGRQIDMSDILQDPVAMFHHRHIVILNFLMSVIVPVLCGVYLMGETWQCSVAWLLFIRNMVVFHSEMTVNSLAHIYGNKPYNKNIRPTQNIFVSVMTGGEGFHNYHHMFPYDYKAAEGFEFPNYSMYFIKIWAKMGLVYDLKEPTPQLVQAVLNKQTNGKKNHKQFTNFDSLVNSTEEKKSRK